MKFLNILIGEKKADWNSERIVMFNINPVRDRLAGFFYGSGLFGEKLNIESRR